MKNRISLFLLAFIVWCLLNWIPDAQTMLVGVLVAAFAAYMTGDLFLGRMYLFKHPIRYWYFLVEFIPCFVWECLKANLDVAYRVIHPALPIQPGIVKVQTRLKTAIGLTFLANSITLTPGTMTVDIDVDRAVLYIHWLYVKDKDIEKATELIARRFENILLKIFE